MGVRKIFRNIVRFLTKKMRKIIVLKKRTKPLNKSWAKQLKKTWATQAIKINKSRANNRKFQEISLYIFLISKFTSTIYQHHKWPLQLGYKKLPFNPRNFNNKRNERNGQRPNTYFRCGLEDNFIANCQKPDTSDKKVHWNTKKLKNGVYR